MFSEVYRGVILPSRHFGHDDGRHTAAHARTAHSTRHLSLSRERINIGMTMVPIRLTSVLRTSPNNNGGRHHPTYRLIFCSASIAALGLTAIYLLSPRQPYDPQPQQEKQQQQQHDVASLRGRSGSDLAMITKEKTGGRGGAQKNKDELDEEDLDPLKITQGSITYNGNNNNVSYYHCGPLPSSTSMPSTSSSSSSSSLTELILLHGAAFTKENWKTSGILDMFCEINNTEDEGNLSVLALDLPVSADGTELGYVFDALVSRKILSGLPVTFVTPSASGHAIVSLAEESAMSSTTSMNEEAEVKLTKGSDHINNLTRMVKAWIPVASFAVLSASDDTLLQYTHANIPILAIHGDQDLKGKGVTERLKDTNKNNARGVELEGRHPVYLDSPEEFVREVMQFLDEMGL